MNNVKTLYLMAQATVSGAVAFLSARLGIMLYVAMILGALMVVDFISGMAASKKEALEHPGDPAYGWSSKKGAEGILKKVGYMFIIMVALCVDFIIIEMAAYIGIAATIKPFFGIMAMAWYILNEMLSITENAGRMGAPVPDFLARYIAVLKSSVENKANKNTEE